MKAILTCLCVLLLLLFNASTAPAAGWETAHGSLWYDAAHALDIDDSDAVMIGLGHAMPQPSDRGINIAIVKVDLATSNAEWRRVLSPIFFGFKSDACLVNKRSVGWAAAGILPGTDRPGALVGVLSSAGDIQWTRSWFGGTSSRASILLKRRAEIIAVGDVRQSQNELMLSRFNYLGLPLQVRQFYADSDLTPRAAEINSRYEYIVAGSHGTNAFVARFSPSGTFINAYETDATRLDVFDGIALMANDDILLTGWTHSFGIPRAVVVRLRRDLSLRWARHYTSGVPLWGNSIDLRGGVAVMAGMEDRNGFVSWLRTSNGAVLRTHTYGRDRFEHINAVEMSANPTSVYAAGYTMTDSPGAGDMWLLNARWRDDCGSPLNLRAFDWRPNMQKMRLSERDPRGQWLEVDIRAQKLWLEEPLCGSPSRIAKSAPPDIIDLPIGESIFDESDVQSGAFAMKSYPNPLDDTDELTIAIYLEQSETVNIRILDMLGRTVYTWRGSVATGERVLRIRNQMLEPGFYLVEAATTDQTRTQKVIVR